MKPLDYFEQLTLMPNKADKYDLRLRMVNSAIQIGVKPAARLFETTPRTVRKWLKRYRQERLAGLHELPRIPLNCPAPDRFFERYPENWEHERYQRQLMYKYQQQQPAQK